MSVKPPQALSPFSARSEFYIHNGLVIIPIAPGTKKPGAYSNGKWHNMKDWNKFFNIAPTAWQIGQWDSWPEAGIGLLLGQLSGVVAVDIDTDDSVLLNAILKIAGPTPVKKRGKKGLTAFYRWNHEVPHSWDVNKERVVDLLAHGRQTLMPGTQHPDGMSYVYLTDDTLEEFDKTLLPTLPETFVADINALLSPLQTHEDREARRDRAPPRDDGHVELFQSIASTLWKTINQTALDRLDDWVPQLVPGAKPHGSGYRCRAFWRGAENPNVGINPSGIRDFGAGNGLTPIDLVMFANNVNFEHAATSLRTALGLDQGASVSITVNQKEPAPKPMPELPSVDLSKLMKALPAPVAPAPRITHDPYRAAQEESARKEEEERAAQASMLPEFVANAPGLIGEIADWVNQTAPKTQPEFAVVTALTIGATVMGRRFVTDRDNWPSMFYLIVASTGEGKDHPQKCVRKVLNLSGLSRLVGGSGYTSAGAVLTALIRQPSHVAIMDEFGQHLKTMGKNGSQNSDTAMTELMKVITNLNSSVAPQGYSAMTMKKQDITGMDEDRTIYNPAITLMCATTPGVFFGALQDDQLEGGMLNRFIMVQTNEPIRAGQRPKLLPPPDGAIAWCQEVMDEHNATGDLRDNNANDPSQPARPVQMMLDTDSHAMIESFDREVALHRNELESHLADVLARTTEKALRVAMVVAKMTNAPRDNVIRADAVAWAIKYVKHYDYRMLKSIETQRPQSKIETRLREVEKFMKRVKTYRDAAYVKVTQTGAMPHALLLKKMKVDSREMNLIMDTAQQSGLVTKITGVPDVGFAGDVYYLRGEPD